MIEIEQNDRNTYNKALKGGDISSRDSSTHSDAVQAKPLEVKVYGSNFEKAMKAFKALVQKEKILSSYKDAKVYEKPSDKKRRKTNESRRKMMDLERSQEPENESQYKTKRQKRKS